jgi:hypothetical protein
MKIKILFGFESEMIVFLTTHFCPFVPTANQFKSLEKWIPLRILLSVFRSVKINIGAVKITSSFNSS